MMGSEMRRARGRKKRTKKNAVQGQTGHDRALGESCQTERAKQKRSVSAGNEKKNESE